MCQIRFAFILLSALLCGSSYADKVCLKATVKGGKVSFTKKSVVSGACAKGFTEIVDTATLRGPTGAAGAAGATGAIGNTGATGAAGSDGQIKVYGDGSAGVKTISADTSLADANLQYTDFTVNSGVTLTVDSGTIIRCTGAFTNNGTIQVLTGTIGGRLISSLTGGDTSRFFGYVPAHPGVTLGFASSGEFGNSGTARSGGEAGDPLTTQQARQLLKPGHFGGGAGSAPGMNGVYGGNGGGAFVVLAAGGLVNAGLINADGNVEFRGPDIAGGGGAGGVVILASKTSITNSIAGVISAKGGAGAVGDLRTGSGGGGGGGIVHLLAPVVTNSGALQVNGGAAGAVGPSITESERGGGGAGGSCGGLGGRGGRVPQTIPVTAESPEAGSDGQTFLSSLDPTALLL